MRQWPLNTVESRFFEPPRKTKIDSGNLGVRKIEGQNAVFNCMRKACERLSVQAFGSFEKLRVRKIGIPLYKQLIA